MELEYYGGNCVTISTKNARLVIDDNLDKLGLKNVTKAGDIAVFSAPDHEDPKSDAKLVIDTSGEYELSDISIQGVGAKAHDKTDEGKVAVIYKITAADIRVAVVGNISGDLSDSQLEAIGTVDVLVLPVGGGGTLNGLEALKVVRKIEPKVVIPTHYADKQVKYSSEQASLEDSVKDLALEPKPAVDSLKLKPADLLDVTQLVILKRK